VPEARALALPLYRHATARLEALEPVPPRASV
jgi:hypothetical protein